MLGFVEWAVELFAALVDRQQCRAELLQVRSLMKEQVPGTKGHVLNAQIAEWQGLPLELPELPLKCLDHMVSEAALGHQEEIVDMDNNDRKKVAVETSDVEKVVVIERHLEAKAELHEVKQSQLPKQRSVD